MTSLNIPIDDLLGLLGVTDPDTLRQVADVLEKSKAAPETIDPAAYTAEAAVKLARRVAKRVRAAERRKARKEARAKEEAARKAAEETRENYRRALETNPSVRSVLSPHSVIFPVNPHILGLIKETKDSIEPFFKRIDDLFSAADKTPEMQLLSDRLSATREHLDVYIPLLYEATLRYEESDSKDRIAYMRLDITEKALRRGKEIVGEKIES